jgi:hypothetical protein
MSGLPLTKLASLKLSLPHAATISIYHQATEESKKVLIHDAFPKDLAIAMSGYIARALKALPLNQIAVADLTTRPTNTVTIEGGRFESLVIVLKWMLACGKAGRTVQLHYLSSPTFYEYGMVWLSCERLQVQQLPAQVMARMEQIAAMQVHSIDVERIFTSLAGPHKFKEMVCESIGQAMWNERLKAYGAYKALMRMPEYEEFANGTNAVTERLLKEYHATPEGREELKAQEEKATNSDAKRQASAVRRDGQFKERVARRHNVDPADVTVHGNGRFTITAETRTVRNPQRGRPGYVALDLGMAGVTSRQFVRPDFPALAPRKDKSNNDSTANAKVMTPEKDTASKTSAPKVAKDSDSKSKGKAKVDVAVPTPAELSKSVQKMNFGGN